MNKYFKYICKNYLFIVTFFAFALTQFVQQDISITYSYLKSNYPFLIEYGSFQKSIMNAFILVFDFFYFDLESITVFISMFYSSIALLTMMIFGYYFKKLKVVDVCLFICLVFFLEKLKLFEEGFNYPINILILKDGTGGSLGMIFSLLAISIYLYNPLFGLIAIPINLLIHPTLGLLTLSYLFFVAIFKKDYLNMFFMIIVCSIYLFLNLDVSYLSNENLITFIHLNDFHRMPLEVKHFHFLILPIFLTILHSKREELIVEWFFIFICVSISFIYYNLEFNFFELPFLSLMPSRGANIAAAVIIIKSGADLIEKPKLYKMCSLILISFLIYRIFILDTHLTSTLIGCITGLVFVLISTLFRVQLISNEYPIKIIRIKKEYFVGILLSFIIYLNLMTASMNIRQLVNYPIQGYDEFFKSKEETSYYITLNNDVGLMSRNKNMIELIPLANIDGYSFQPKILEKGNQIFKTIFDKNLWDIDVNNSAAFDYSVMGKILESYKKDDWSRIKALGLKYILCPSYAKIKLKRVWEDEKDVIFEL